MGKIKIFGVSLLAIITAILISIITITFWLLVKKGLDDLFNVFGLTNTYLVGAIIITIGVVLLISFGTNIKSIIKEVGKL